MTRICPAIHYIDLTYLILQGISPLCLTSLCPNLSAQLFSVHNLSAQLLLQLSPKNKLAKIQDGSILVATWNGTWKKAKTFLSYHGLTMTQYLNPPCTIHQNNLLCILRHFKSSRNLIFPIKVKIFLLNTWKILFIAWLSTSETCSIMQNYFNKKEKTKIFCWQEHKKFKVYLKFM